MLTFVVGLDGRGAIWKNTPEVEHAKLNITSLMETLEMVLQAFQNNAFALQTFLELRHNIHLALTAGHNLNSDLQDECALSSDLEWMPSSDPGALSDPNLTTAYQPQDEPAIFQNQSMAFGSMFESGGIPNITWKEMRSRPPLEQHNMQDKATAIHPMICGWNTETTGMGMITDWGPILSLPESLTTFESPQFNVADTTALPSAVMEPNTMQHDLWPWTDINLEPYGRASNKQCCTVQSC